MATVPITLTLNATADIPIGNMGYVQLDETSPYVDISGGGVINIPDWQTDFGSTILRNQAEANIWVKIGGVWYDRGKVSPQIVFDGTDTYLQSISWSLNESDHIQKIKITLW